MTKDEILSLLDQMIHDTERGLEFGENVHVDPDELKSIKAYIEGCE